MDPPSNKAFDYEKGQFVCHFYATLQQEHCDTIEDVIRLIEAKQAERKTCAALSGWRPVGANTVGGETALHLTLLRGHRAIYYHQIKHLVSAVQREYRQLEPFSLCLSHLKIFRNFEGTKEFLCLATSQADSQSRCLQLRETLKSIVDEFAIKLSAEDETVDTSAHCSFMYRPLSAPDPSEGYIDEHLNLIDHLWDDCSDDYPMISVKMRRLHVKIGSHEYEFILGF